MSPASESVTGMSAAAGPGILGTIVLMFGFSAPEYLILAVVLIGGLMGGYSGSTFLMLREIAGRTVVPHDWLLLTLRVTASWAFGSFIALGLAAVAGSVESVPAVAGHPFVLLAVAGLLAAVAPLAVPALQTEAARKVRERGRAK